tara:strand:+ start:627 stop:1007 length:381 start_codon:yes stop_codon:yes gene_type:complete
MARYTDFDLNMTRHPLTGDVAPVDDVTAIKRSVKHIVLTNFGERPFKPNFGSNIRAQLFEQATPFAALSLRNSIKFALKKYEPRIDIIEITVVDNHERNGYDVSLNFLIRHIHTDVRLSIKLTRAR